MPKTIFFWPESKRSGAGFFLGLEIGNFFDPISCPRGRKTPDPDQTLEKKLYLDIIRTLPNFDLLFSFKKTT